MKGRVVKSRAKQHCSGLIPGPIEKERGREKEEEKSGGGERKEKEGELESGALQ